MEIGRIILLLGLMLVVIGLILLFLPKLFIWFGNLPGDIRIERQNTKLFIPIGSMIVISIILTLLVNIFNWVYSIFSKWK